MSGLRAQLDEIVADVPVYGDLDLAIERADREQRLRRVLVAGVAAAAVAVVLVAGVLVAGGRRDAAPPVGPSPTPTPSQSPSETQETIPRDPSELLVVRQVGANRLEVAGRRVPGRWGLTDSSRDVWVATRTDASDYESQWWGKGTTTHKMPPSMGSVLRGGVVISPDARWIAWTRPAADVYGKNPPRVMEVVDTATGKVRWSRTADADAPELGALAVTNDAVVVFAHCLERVLDSGGWPQCDDARVDVWAPETGSTRTLPAEVSVSHGPPGTVTVLSPLVRATGAHNGLLVQDGPGHRPSYVRVSARGAVQVVASLPRRTLAVTADERFALVDAGCGHRPCRWTVVSLADGERRPMQPPARLEPLVFESWVSYVAERDDMLLVRADEGPAVAARCSLAQARCVLIGPS